MFMKVTTENAYCCKVDHWVEITKRLDRMPYAQAGILIDERGTHLISYQTLVCTIDNDGWLTCTGTYSQTTRKHIGAFLHEVAPLVSYYIAKRCYEKGQAYNVRTGLVMDLETGEVMKTA